MGFDSVDGGGHGGNINASREVWELGLKHWLGSICISFGPRWFSCGWPCARGSYDVKFSKSFPPLHEVSHLVFFSTLMVCLISSTIVILLIVLYLVLQVTKGASNVDSMVSP